MNIGSTLAITGVVLAFGWPVPRLMAADAQKAKALYEKNCASCHGTDGKGNPGMVKVLGEKGLNIVTKETTEKSDEQLLKIIADGAGKMPPSKKLTKEEQKQTLDYSRSLAK